MLEQATQAQPGPDVAPGAAGPPPAADAAAAESRRKPVMKFLEGGRALFPPSALRAPNTAGRGAWAEAAPRGGCGWPPGLVPSRGYAGHVPVLTPPREVPHRSPGCKWGGGRVEMWVQTHSWCLGGTRVPRLGDWGRGQGPFWVEGDSDSGNRVEKTASVVGSTPQAWRGGPRAPRPQAPECLSSLGWPPRAGGTAVVFHRAHPASASAWISSV